MGISNFNLDAFFCIYMYFYAFMALTCLLTENGRHSKQARFFACFFCFLGLQLLMGLRHINFAGVDSRNYANEFLNISRGELTIDEIFIVFYKDFGFYIFAKFVSLFTSSFNVFLFICAFPYNFAAAYLIYKYSDDVFLSFTIFFALGFWAHNFQLVRHVFAVSIVIFAVIQLLNGHDRNFFILTAIATTFHISAILILGVYPVRNTKPGLKQVLWLMFGLFIVFSGRDLLLRVFSLTTGLNASRFFSYVERARNADLGDWRNYVLKFGIFLTIVWYAFTRKNRQGKLYFNHKGHLINKNLCFNLMVISVVAYTGQAIVGEAYRMAQFFSIFVIIIIPAALKMLKDRLLRFLLTSCIIFFSLKYFLTLLTYDSVYFPYRFFWEGAQLL